MRIRSNWTGFPGAPGYTNMFFGTTDPILAGATTQAGLVRTFWDSIKTTMPNTVTISVDPLVQVLDDTDGKVFQEVSVSPAPTAVVGSQTGSYPAAAGGAVTWNTISFHDGKKVRGRTYLVPLYSLSFGTGGTLDDTLLTTIRNAANALVTNSGKMVVFSRPRVAKAATRIDGKDAVTARAGSSYPVTSATVRDATVVLRSRRD